MHVLINGKERDVKIEDVNAQNYIVPENERHVFHVKQEIRSYDPKTGRKISVPVVQKYGAKTFAQIERQLKLQGWELEILYNPKAFLEEMKNIQKKSQEDRKKLAEAAMNKKIEEAVNAALEKQAKMFEEKIAQMTKKSSKKAE